MKLNPVNENLIDETMEVWRSQYSKEISREAAREILASAVRFFDILARWEKAEQTITIAQTNNNSYLIPTESKEVMDEVKAS